ncbi:MAG: hypothetical protein CSH37_14325 [Thalassolituus sp.]|nr:MAG: hypothetical protein CSH37_14325 [Thalassolituus sp.]
MTTRSNKAAKHTAPLVLMSLILGTAEASLPDGYKIAVEFDQHIEGVAPEMLDWWWNNIRTEQRFIDWNPEQHIAFELVEPPANPDSLDLAVGTVQNISEYLGGFTIDTQVTWAEPYNTGAGDYQLVAEIEFQRLQDISIPGNGWLVYDYQPDEDLTGTDVHATLLLPEVASIAFPGIKNTLTEHLRSDLTRTSEFLPDLFQQEFIETELESRGTYRVEKNGFWLRTVIDS